MKLQLILILGAALTASSMQAMTKEKFKTIATNYKKGTTTRQSVISAYETFKHHIDISNAYNALRVILNTTIETLRIQEGWANGNQVTKQIEELNEIELLELEQEEALRDAEDLNARNAVVIQQRNPQAQTNTQSAQQILQAQQHEQEAQANAQRAQQMRQAQEQEQARLHEQEAQANAAQQMLQVQQQEQVRLREQEAAARRQTQLEAQARREAQLRQVANVQPLEVQQAQPAPNQIQALVQNQAAPALQPLEGAQDLPSHEQFARERAIREAQIAALQEKHQANH